MSLFTRTNGSFLWNSYVQTNLCILFVYYFVCSRIEQLISNHNAIEISTLSELFAFTFVDCRHEQLENSLSFSLFWHEFQRVSRSKMTSFLVCMYKCDFFLFFFNIRDSSYLPLSTKNQRIAHNLFFCFEWIVSFFLLANHTYSRVFVSMGVSSMINISKERDDGLLSIF